MITIADLQLRDILGARPAIDERVDIDGQSFFIARRDWPMNTWTLTGSPAAAVLVEIKYLTHWASMTVLCFLLDQGIGYCESECHPQWRDLLRDKPPWQA